LEIDTTKMPLGLLSRSHIRKGFEVLNEIEKLIEQGGDGAALVSASNRFYTVIPHAFGHRAPAVISSKQQIKDKADMLESLLEMEVASRLMKEQQSQHSKKDHPLERCYGRLRADIRPLQADSPEFGLVQRYVNNTHGQTHSSYRLDVVGVYAVSRHEEEKRYEAWRDNSNRQLLWHGSRLSNYVGILSQGLRIAPPEAPVTGYMFGKGVYFADMVSKSANYCFASANNAANTTATGLLTLCEVALGDMYCIPDSEYMERAPPGFHSTKGVGATHPDPKESERTESGVLVPCGRPVPTRPQPSQPGQPNQPQPSALLYNEYIVYDVSQIRMKYLVQVKFSYK